MNKGVLGGSKSMAEKKKILYIVEAMGGGVFTYIVGLANELVNKYPFTVFTLSMFFFITDAAEIII